MKARATSPDEENTCLVLDYAYFRIRDFEYVQPIYDLSFFLEVEPRQMAGSSQKYRSFSLWKAAYSLDGYGTSIDRWLDGSLGDQELDYRPTNRLKQYLLTIRSGGTHPELEAFYGDKYHQCLQLRALRGLGSSGIASFLSLDSPNEAWLAKTAFDTGLHPEDIADLLEGAPRGPWQTAHIVPPLLRFLRRIEVNCGGSVRWALQGIPSPFEPVKGPIVALADLPHSALEIACNKALKQEQFFRRLPCHGMALIVVEHQMGWSFTIGVGSEDICVRSVTGLAGELDPLAIRKGRFRSDLHSHTAWSDGTASVDSMAHAVAQNGLEYFAVTDHSRSSKLQGGLTPPLWLKQATALELARPVCPIMHGIEVDILRDGSLDLPHSLLAATDIVVASVHSNWSKSARINTDRLLRSIESGSVDIIGHPSSTVIGKPGVPDYYRPPADVFWDEVFERCSQWRVALEMNCFPSRLDLSLELLVKAIDAGCAISMGSDAHARTHLLNLRFGEAAAESVRADLVLNQLSYQELTKWITESRSLRKGLRPSGFVAKQIAFSFEEAEIAAGVFNVSINPPAPIPIGSRIVGLDLTAGKKATGVALLDANRVETCSLTTDEEILEFVAATKPSIVSIDSPLGLPGGGSSIDAAAGIVRVAESDLASIGIPAYPALIDSMRNLTLRGMRLRRAIESIAAAPRVIESYPGAAQDILSIPRKQRSLDLLREGLQRLGLTGAGLQTRSHDEMDAITSAIVGRYFESGRYEPMGIPSEAELIVPKVSPLRFHQQPVICLAGKSGAGKSVVARYLSVFYGFIWIRTRSVIRELLLEDQAKQLENRIIKRQVDLGAISEVDLQEFGALVLNEHNQVPLRQKLTEIVQRLDRPIVVDAIRNALDVDVPSTAGRPIQIWCVDCSDSVIRQRLAVRRKDGVKTSMASPVDATAPSLHHIAGRVIANYGSLEELRWHLDDVLFGQLEFSRTGSA